MERREDYELDWVLARGNKLVILFDVGLWTLLKTSNVEITILNVDVVIGRDPN
jgi:hypothetical protein